MKSIFNIIEEYIKIENWSGKKRSAFYLDILNYIPFNAETSPSNWKKQINELTIPKDKKDYPRLQNRRDVIRAAVWKGIPIDLFNDIEYKYIYPPEQFNFKDESFIPISGLVENAGTRSIYKQTTERFLEEECLELSVIDYLGRGDRKKPTYGLNEYFKMHASVFKNIEDKIKTNYISGSYKRFLGLHLKEEIENENQILNQVILQSSPQLFHHICRSLSDPKITHKKAFFYFSSDPLLTFQVAMKKYEDKISIYEEQYKLTNGDSYPFYICIRSSSHELFCETYRNLIDKASRDLENNLIVYDRNLSNETRNPNDIVRAFLNTLAANATLIKSNPSLKNITDKKISTFNKCFEDDDSICKIDYF